MKSPYFIQVPESVLVKADHIRRNHQTSYYEIIMEGLTNAENLAGLAYTHADNASFQEIPIEYPKQIATIAKVIKLELSAVRELLETMFGIELAQKPQDEE